MIIDAHTHVIPPPLVARVRTGRCPLDVRIEVVDGQEWVIHGGGFRYPLDPRFLDINRRLERMTEDGVDGAVLSLAPPFLGYGLPVGVAIEHARLVNDGLAEMVSGRETLAALATLPMQDPRAAAEELARAVELGLVGAQLGANVEDRPLDDPAFTPVLAAAQDLAVPLVIHPAYTGPLPGLEDFYLTNLCGNPWQTGVCASRLILSGSLDRYPGLDVMLVHAGGHLPYQVGRLDHGTSVRSDAGVCAHPPSSYLGRFAYDTLAYSSEALNYLVERVGAGRVLYGTDVPFDMDGGSPEAQLEGVRLSDSERARVLGGNAIELFGLGHG